MSVQKENGGGRKGNQTWNKSEFPDYSWRLTFLYDKGYIELRAAKRLNMIAPPTDKLGKLDQCTGFCCELRTTRGRVLYRRFGSDPIRNDIEVHGGNSDDKFTKVAIENPSVEFDILVPIVEKAAKIVLLGDTSGNKAVLMKPISEFNLSDLPSKK